MGKRYAAASRKLVAFLRSKGVYERYMPAACGTWTEGSCLRLAVAVEEWARLSGVRGWFAAMRREDDRRIEHVFYAVGAAGEERLLDGDGVHTVEAALYRWRVEEALDVTLEIGISRRVAYGADAARPDPSMKRLGLELYEKFGPIQEFVR